MVVRARTVIRALLAGRQCQARLPGSGRPTPPVRWAAGRGPVSRRLDWPPRSSRISKAAKAQFIKMATLSTLPDSITQAEFWLGRTELAMGDKAAAKAAFTKAAQHGTLYYGLLARAQLD